MQAIELLPLVLIAFSAGLIDAAVGGGGLIQVPGLFSTLPQHTPSTLFGTNKFSSVFGTGMAAWRYARQIDITWKLVIPAALTAFAFSFIGAMAVSYIPPAWMRPLVLALMLFMLGYTLRKKDFGALHRPSHIGRRELIIALAIGGAIGFYDGLFGPGTGSFLIFLFIRFFGFDFLRASSAAKIVNVATNLAALAFFIPAGHVLYHYAIPMAVANIAGAFFGARMAMRGGTTLIRKLFIGLVSVLIAKLAWDIFGTLLAR
ncbi:MAG: TSUP family transporter [Chitinimonas sp.]|nr:TSUP family transporter [Chitinimonas sp.]